MFGKNSKMSWNANDKGCKQERIQVTKWFAYNLLFLQTGNTTPSKQSLKGDCAYFVLKCYLKILLFHSVMQLTCLKSMVFLIPLQLERLNYQTLLKIFLVDFTCTFSFVYILDKFQLQCTLLLTVLLDFRLFIPFVMTFFF